MPVAILRIVLGLLFLVSAVSKLFPVDAFELVLIRQLGISWAAAPYFARALILCEFILGSFLVFGVRPRLTLSVALVTLLGFTLHLAVLIALGRGGQDCGCFGEWLPMDAPTSIIKNAVFIALNVVLLARHRQAGRLAWKYGPWILSALAVPAVFLLFPLPEAIRAENTRLDAAVFEQAGIMDKTSITSKKVVLILYADCVHCKQVANLLATAGEEAGTRDWLIVMFGKKEKVDTFVLETGLSGFDRVHTADRTLIASFNGTFPTLVELDSGEVRNTWQGNNITKSLLTRLMKTSQ